VSFFVMAAQRQSVKIRTEYFRSLLRQEMGWFDEQETGALTSRIGDDVNKIQEAIGDKVGAYVQFMTMFISGMIIAFVSGWRLALVILSVLPLLAAVGFFFSKVMSQAATKGQTFYANAGGIAYEAIGLIRTVIAFGTQNREANRYNTELETAAKAGIRTGMFSGIGLGFSMFVMFATYGLGFWSVSKLAKRQS
jgi:ABC-type multidrug transport system fused ATPase/permease subunit